MTAPRPDTSLDDIRREIDEIDDAILDLVARRFAATERVAAAKTNDGSIAVSPFRPAREASLLRRLVARSNGRLTSQFLVRLWRVILSSSTQAQAAVTIHTGPLNPKGDELPVRLTEHFCGMSVMRHGTTAEALTMLSGKMGDLAVIPADADWPGAFKTLGQTTLKIIGRLPDKTGASRAFIFGHADVQPTGDDETIILTQCKAGSGAAGKCRWNMEAGGWSILAIAGFLGEDDRSVQAILSADDDACIAGRYPTPIEIMS